MGEAHSSEAPDLRSLPGMVATVVTTGHVEEMFSRCLMELRSWADREGFHKIEWRFFVNPFVEAGRDEAVAHMLKEGYQWLLQIDADAAFQPDVLLRLLQDAYLRAPDSDGIGAYCQTKGKPYLPTIDTGTGTWEVHYPGEGLLPVIRTGGHCLLVKRPILEELAPGPWFRVREGVTPARSLLAIDNLARIHFDGENPLAGQEAWEKLAEVSRGSGGDPGSVGEDSAFCDRVQAAGGRLYVDTDVVTGHITKYVIGPEDLKEAQEEEREKVRAACGLGA